MSTLSSEVLVALIMAFGSIIASAVAIILGRSNVKDLREIIAELRSEVDDLRNDNEDLKDWAERLVCQVKDAGMVPVSFIRKMRDKKLVQ